MSYNKITLYGNQICDYLYIQNSRVDINNFSSVNSEPSEWNNDTVLFSTFDNKSLVGGNSDILENINGYEIRRKKSSDSYNEYVATISDGDKNYIIDYLPSNKTTYSYYIYPKASFNNDIILNPIVSEDIEGDWNYWSLLIVDESDVDGVFYLNKLFKFELNVEVDDLNNNSQISVTHNFTKYPTIQYAPSNFWSGGLSSLCGFISCDDLDYVQTPNMINELKSLTSDTRRKFLKDTEGNLWEVKITSPINISTNNETLQKIKSVKISWTEVNEVKNISIINNPNSSTTSWLLTESGEVVPYLNYVWDAHYKWDNSYRWTAREDLLETTKSNIGRDLYSKEGDGE